MIRFSIPYFYNLSAELEPLARLPFEETPLRNVKWVLLTAHNSIRGLSQNSMYARYLRASYSLSQELLNKLSIYVSNIDETKVLSVFEVHEIRSLYERYKWAFLAEVGVMDTYFVQKKGAFDTFSLLTNGETLFPEDMITKVPSAVFDAKQAGQCLAFENATASGFHLFRVLETVLRSYYHHVTGGKALPKVRNIAVYVEAMRQARAGEENTLFLLKQISTRYRNPLIHPDVVLSVDDAIAIHGLVRTAVTHMLSEMPAATLTTQNFGGMADLFKVDG